MSNLWDLSQIQPETRVVLEGDTIPAMFWNAVEAARRCERLDAPEGAGHLAQLDLEPAPARPCARSPAG
jgi:hypothetical protein